MPASETISIIQNLADVIGLPALAIETGFLLIFMILILLVVFFVRAILRIREETIKFSAGVGYIANLLKTGIDKRKIAQGYYDFRVEEWKDDTRNVVLAMLQKGMSDNEIMEEIDVSQAYINKVRKWAINEGILFKKVLK
jgi:hypothetical protein